MMSLRPLLIVCMAVSSAAAGGEISPQAALGWKLFFDVELSRNKTHACATCHVPERGFTDGVGFGKGTHGDTLPRNTPTVVNLAEARHFFWDGREESLEAQAVAPLTNPIEMDLTPGEIVARVKANRDYQKAFAAIGVDNIDLDAIVAAIAAFERNLVTGATAYDRWLAGDKEALSPAAARGRMIFFTRGQCAICHIGPNFTDNDFHNIGTGKARDAGRYAVTGDAADRGRFKVPSLRNWRGTEPFMHDGSFATMAEVLDFYSEPPPPELGESELDPLELDADEKSDLLMFLETLNGDWPDLAAYPARWRQSVSGDSFNNQE